VVFGVGNPQAEILLVGEGPGREEDLQGEPFVGRAGKLLDKILASIDLSRQEVYIANIVKCRPPENREPWPDEVTTCWPFLVAQILLINPRITVALGSPAARTLLSTKQPISKIRGKYFPFCLPRPGSADWQGWLLPTYHPAFLLRNPGKKREVWEDMKSLREELLHPGSQTAAANQDNPLG
jgi:DNA polymerase